MSRYPKYATTVIGAHSVPDWYEALDRLVAVGQLGLAAMADTQYRCTEAAVLENANIVKDSILLNKPFSTETLVRKMREVQDSAAPVEASVPSVEL